MTDDSPTTPADSPTDATPTGWAAAPAPTSTATSTTPPPPPTFGPSGPTPWYGTAAAAPRKGPKPPWFWPIVAVAVGLAALLVGGGVGFAVGHAIGGAGHGTTQVPGTNGGGTGQFPGDGPRGGTGTGSDTSGSAGNS